MIPNDITIYFSKITNEYGLNIIFPCDIILSLQFSHTIVKGVINYHSSL